MSRPDAAWLIDKRRKASEERRKRSSLCRYWIGLRQVPLGLRSLEDETASRSADFGIVHKGAPFNRIEHEIILGQLAFVDAF